MSEVKYKYIEDEGSFGMVDEHELPSHVSEAIMPAIEHYVGVRWKRYHILVEERKSLTLASKLNARKLAALKRAIFRELTGWWYGMNAISSFSVACEGSAYFSVTSGNLQSMVADVIKDEIGYCPITKYPKDHSAAIYFERSS